MSEILPLQLKRQHSAGLIWHIFRWKVSFHQLELRDLRWHLIALWAFDGVFQWFHASLEAIGKSLSIVSWRGPTRRLKFHNLNRFGQLSISFFSCVKMRNFRGNLICCTKWAGKYGFLEMNGGLVIRWGPDAERSVERFQYIQMAHQLTRDERENALEPDFLIFFFFHFLC